MATLLDLTNRVKGEMGLSTGEYTLTVKGGSITAFADYDSTVTGTVLITSAGHGLETGEYVAITSSTYYNTSANALIVTVVNNDTFYITASWESSQTGKWVAIYPSDIFVVNDVKFSFYNTASLVLEMILIALDTADGKDGVALSMASWINNVFSQGNTGSSVSASAPPDSNVVTITGASRVFTIAPTLPRGTTEAGTPTEQLNKALAINTVSSEDEPPSTSDIFQFIKDAQYDLINKLHENAFIKDDTGLTSGMIRLVDFTNTSFVDKKQVDLGSVTHYNGSVDSSVAILKVLELSYKSNTKNLSTMTESDNKSRAEKVPFDLLQDIRDGNHSFYKAESYTNSTPIPKFYSVLGNVLELSHELSSTVATQNLSVLALCKPNEVLATECSFGEHLQDLIVMYAKAKSYDLINRADLSTKIMNDYNQMVGVVNIKHSTKETSKFEREIPK